MNDFKILTEDEIKTLSDNEKVIRIYNYFDNLGMLTADIATGNKIKNKDWEYLFILANENDTLIKFNNLTFKEKFDFYYKHSGNKIFYLHIIIKHGFYNIKCNICINTKSKMDDAFLTKPITIEDIVKTNSEDFISSSNLEKIEYFEDKYFRNKEL